MCVLVLGALLLCKKVAPEKSAAVIHPAALSLSLAMLTLVLKPLLAPTCDFVVALLRGVNTHILNRAHPGHGGVGAQNDTETCFLRPEVVGAIFVPRISNIIMVHAPWNTHKEPPQTVQQPQRPPPLVTGPPPQTTDAVRIIYLGFSAGSCNRRGLLIVWRMIATLLENIRMLGPHGIFFQTFGFPRRRAKWAIG